MSFDFDFDLKALRDKLEDEEKPVYENDNTRFVPSNLKDGTLAIVRVMPTHDNADWRVEHVYHQVNGKGKMYTCPQQFDYKEPCPFCERAKSYYEKGNKDMGNKFWKKRRYASYVRVKNAEELGLTELQEPTVWWYGTTINDKFKAAVKDDEIGVFFHPITGYDFKLRKESKDQYANYDTSEFARSSSKLHDNEKVIQALFAARTDLHELIDAPLSYDELSKIVNGGGSQENETQQEDEIETGTTNRLPEKNKEEAKTTSESTSEESGDDELAAILAKINRNK